MKVYKKVLLVLCSVLPLNAGILAQTDTVKTAGKTDKIKKGWNFGALPAIAYDTDIGFKYGALVNLFNYGDGKQYPKYLHSLYFEWSHTTKGSGTTSLHMTRSI